LIFALYLNKKNHLKAFLLFLLCIIANLNSYAQNFHLEIKGSSNTENQIINSLKYISEHKNIKSADDEISTTTTKLSKLGYIDTQVTEKTKKNDSTYYSKLSLGERIKTIHIYIGINNLENHLVSSIIKKDTLSIPYTQTESFLNQTLQKLEENGYALAQLKLTNFKREKDKLFAELKIDTNKPRVLSSIIISYTEKENKEHFPEGSLKQINRKYKNKIFNKKSINEIHNDFQKFTFVNQIKYPELLLTKDSSKVYVYLEKRKSNTFEGFIGFSNNENKKIKLNGYLDLNLENILKTGEEISIYWKSDQNKQKTFKAGIDLPYIFKSPLSLKSQIQIFKQDSTFQNTKTAIDLGYIINHNTRIYLGYQSTESNDIQNTNNNSISDYKNSFTNTSFKYSKIDSDNIFFNTKTNIEFAFGLGSRTTKNLPETAGASKQFQIKLDAMYNFYLNKKNYINFKTQNYFLESNSYITNELYRFGGINSIRGFEENSLQAQYFTSIITEYRYIISPQIYIHTILDYCIYKDPFNLKKETSTNDLTSIGIGIGILSKEGVFKLILANGSSKNQEIKFYNTIINICYNVKF
jgi:hypothetical protein